MTTFWDSFIGQAVTNDNKNDQWSWRQGMEKRLTDLTAKADKGTNGRLSGLLSFRGQGGTEQSLDEHGKSLRSKRSILMLCADTLRATASMVLGDPLTAASTESTKTISSSMPPPRTPIFRAWTTRRKRIDAATAFELPEVRLSATAPCPSVMGINIPSSQLLLRTSALRSSEDSSFYSIPHRHHRRSSLTSEILWPTPVSIALTPILKPHVKIVGMEFDPIDISQNPYKTETEGEFLGPAAMASDAKLSMTENSDGYLSGTESNAEFSGTDGFEVASLNMDKSLKAPAIPPGGIRLHVQNVGRECENIENAAILKETQSDRLTSSNYEADEEDNLPIPTMGCRKEHEVKRAGRAERYSLIWGDPIEDSKVRACLDYEDGFLYSDDDKEVAPLQPLSILGKENKVKPKEKRPSSDMPWKKTVRWVEDDVLKASVNGTSSCSSREPPPYDSWNGTLIFNENVFEVDSLHADLRNGFLVVGPELSSAKGSPYQELAAPLWSEVVEPIQDANSLGCDIDPAWNVANDLFPASRSPPPTHSKASDSFPPRRPQSPVPRDTNAEFLSSRSPRLTPLKASDTLPPQRPPTPISSDAFNAAQLPYFT